MKIGMMWFDNSPKKSLPEKCNGAIQYFTDKYGMRPTVIVVHPSMATATDTKDYKTVLGVTIEISRSVLPNHFWIGTDIPELQSKEE